MRSGLRARSVKDVPAAADRRVMSDVVTPAPASAGGGAEESTRARRGLIPARASGRSTRLIGEVVVDLGMADRKTVDRAVEVAREQGRPTGQVLLDQGVLHHDQLARAVAERFGLDYVDLSVFDIDMGAVSQMSMGAAKRYKAVPIGFGEDDALLVAMADPTNVLTIDDVAMMTGRRIRPVATSAEDLDVLLARLVRMDESIEDFIDEEPEGQTEAESLAEAVESDAPVIKLVHSLVHEAVAQGASDVHINPEEGDTRVLYRIDGLLYPTATIKRRMAMRVFSRIKIMADLDIAERRVPQDGRIALTLENRRVDIRVVTLPLVHGESCVLRILDKGEVLHSLELLGMHPTDLERFGAAIARPNGAVLV